MFGLAAAILVSGASVANDQATKHDKRALVSCPPGYCPIDCEKVYCECAPC
ncbi:uncharacterized protein L969DRAFT_50463 [Mixia osmundae IAM 14324]|uniref:Uncharacterized protein n=1 Tax=Mixia osmundae (strain CBS 9802 / IAM 14324 / JCM 22182 / KY 12970) TaxID=764103 RepID=G7E6Y1_MIXOS|nr:uncharacterized protein L969DRAFT_50463 [Mixia osmundae IAM 14324]KEI39026.1 hypothetical protein L969DRAFT_50463 [Mixia osmundae IAM 14324]GAA98591.1 hypothetical protein E5Q_05278 [Mixia osmundae IAM 14324]